MPQLRQRVQDVLIALALLAFLIIDLLTNPGADGAPAGWSVLVLAPAVLSLAVRRTHPLVPMVVTAVCYGLAGFTVLDITQLAATLPPVLVAGYSAGRYAADARLPLALAFVTITLVNLGAHEQNVDNWVFPIFAYGSAIITGRGLRTRALVAAELAERTERLAVEQDLRAAEAAVEERRRIARELHDVVAHTLSVMVVQAGAARRTLGRDAALAGEALDTVEATGRSALGELRRMLGFVGAGGGETDAAPLDPQPTTADLGALTRRAGAAGLPTELRIEGEPGGLPAGEEVAVFRIVQEALTNTLKHAGPGASATVTVRWAPEAVEVEVVDRGGAGAGATALPAGGHGLVGMRERVALFRGRFEAGPAQGGGGFRVLARLPRETATVAA
jgi:signal transduction histidine kinase